MKPKNFPKRKYLKRVNAYAFLIARLKKYDNSKLTSDFWENKRKILREYMENIEKKVINQSAQSQREVRTKKRRG